MGPDQYGITINPHGLTKAYAATYSVQVRENLKSVERTKMGKILLNSIRYYGRPVEILPYMGRLEDCRATAQMQVVPPTIGGVFEAIRTLGQSQVKGVIHFSPVTWSKHGKCQPAGIPRVGEMAHEVLFHELVHVFRFVSGKSVKTATFDSAKQLHGALADYADDEEFYAVMLQNIYYADRTNKVKTYYRGEMPGWPLGERVYEKPWGIFSQSSQVFDLVERFCNDHKGLSKRAATELADAEFNPLRDFYQDREKARAISRAAISKDLKILAKEMTGWSF
jgi:hypothetical protein